MTDIRESRELDVTGLNKTELMERDSQNWMKSSAVAMWLKDSMAWMEAAILMNDSSIQNRPEGEPMDHNRMNYAYELLMKSIARADGVDIDPTHQTRGLFEKLGDERKQEIRKAIAKHDVEHEVENAKQYLDDVYERAGHKDRKYGMIRRDMSSVSGGMIFDLTNRVLSISGLARIHQEIVDIGWQALEGWEKKHSEESAAIIPALRSGEAKAES